MEVIECHVNVWAGVEDKSQLIGIRTKLRFLFSWLFAYPPLVWKYLQLPAHDAVIIGYMGQLDILLLWPFARLRKAPIVWDAFLSLYDTIINDRQIFSKYSPLAWILYAWEWLACRFADKIFLDTLAHARYFETLFRLVPGSVDRIFVGAETDIFFSSSPLPVADAGSKPFTVLFYGQFIPLHGIDVIVHAAKIVEQSGEDIHWILIGKGQEKKRIDVLMEKLQVNSIKSISWVPYIQLAEQISHADVCLGIFGTSGKAQRVIPNKVYQILAMNRPLVTADTLAIRELLEKCSSPGIQLVPPGNAEALAAVILRMKAEKLKSSSGSEYLGYNIPNMGPAEVGKQLDEILNRLLNRS